MDTYRPDLQYRPPTSQRQMGLVYNYNNESNHVLVDVKHVWIVLCVEDYIVLPQE